MNKNVRKIQQRLKELGFDPGPVDGIRGRGTIGAVKRFQAANGLVVDGLVGKNTIRALFSVQEKSSQIDFDHSTDDMPWMDKAREIEGLHEKRDFQKLWSWLRRDGATVGDPRKIPWCFEGSVEILTDLGWQRLDNLSASKVAQVDETGVVSMTEYFPVTKDYHGEAYKIENSSVSLIADKEHRWWGNWGNYGRSLVPTKDRFGTLEELGSQGLTLRNFSGGSKERTLSDDQLHMLAAFISDGFYHRDKIEIQVSKERKLKALHSLNPTSVYEAKTIYGDITTKPLTTFTFDKPEFFNNVLIEKHLIFDEITNWSKEQSKKFIDFYQIYDGSVRKKDGRITLYTSDQHTLDALTTIVGLAGYSINIETGGNSSLTKKKSWRIDFTTTPQNRRIMKKHVSSIDFDGKMYCVTVPTSRIIVRGNNKVPVVTGNCGDFVQTAIALSMPEETIPNNPYLAANWVKFGKSVKPQLGSVLVFWRGSPSSWKGHVGFYAGETRTHYLVLGGNQRNSVNEALIAKNRLRKNGSRWPTTALEPNGQRVVVDSRGRIVTTNEA